MKTAVFVFSEAGCALAEKLRDLLPGEQLSVHSIPKYAGPHGFTAHESLRADMGGLFASHDALIFIGACGIAVREIAPHIKSKLTDPAVVVLDDHARFVIPILSGHIGGANALAELLAARLGAAAVITTATDLAGRFACDSWAVKNGCAISSMKAAKDFSAEILQRDLPVCSDYPLPAVLPPGLRAGTGGKIGLYIGLQRKEPFEETLRLVPRLLILGIGCRKGTAADAIRAAAEKALAQENLDGAALAGIASIDIKQNEEGLLSYAKEQHLPLRFYTAEELASAETPGGFAESDFVRRTVGVGNVCERAAVLSGGKLLVRKTVSDGVTAALAVRDWRLEF